MMNIRYTNSDETQSVELIASGYEWTCPRCDHLNTEIASSETVTCVKCGSSFNVDYTYHAEG